LEVARPDWANGITATIADPNDDLHGSASSSDWFRGSHRAAGYNKTFASRANCGGLVVFLQMAALHREGPRPDRAALPAPTATRRARAGLGRRAGRAEAARAATLEADGRPRSARARAGHFTNSKSNKTSITRLADAAT